MKKIFLAYICLFFGTNTFAQYTDIQPVPQQMTDSNRLIQLPDTYLLSGDVEANSYAVKTLKQLLANKQSGNSGMKIYIGEKGDKVIRPFARKIPKQKEGYYLSIGDNEIVLAGNDERGTYYAVQTLSQLLNDNQLPIVEIKDYPSVRYRGVVEGFYGTPWSHAARLRQLKFYGENKMNTYIYGPKDDPYHSAPNWRLPYPEKEAKQLQELVRVAKENEVDFVWAIHPGQDIKWNQEDRDLLLAKFEKMYDLGVRSFAVFFDDISGEGTNPTKQAELLNYIDEHFVKVKQEVTPLVMCPTEYNKSWSNPAKGYLTTLGEKLNSSIQIMWTGDRVISDITKEGIQWINERIKRPAYIWWNFPVSDYVRDHLLLGPVYGNDTQIANQMSGFVTNPMEHAEASKIAIFGVASYTWNPEKYNSQQAWEDAIKNIMPEAATELQFFAEHNSDLGANGHQYRREESLTLQPVAKNFINNYIQTGNYNELDFHYVQETFNKMTESSDILMAHHENNPLINEMMPWLYQFKLLGETGQEILVMLQAYNDNNQELFIRKYKHVKALQQQMFQVDQTYNQNPYQPGAKTASKVIKPLIDQTFAVVIQKYNKKYNTQLDAATDYMPHKIISDIAQIKNLPLQVKTDKIQISPALEVIKWQPKGSFIVELDKIYQGKTIDIDFGNAELTNWGNLEISSDGVNWEKISLQKKTHNSINIASKLIKAVRFTNEQDKEQEIYLRRFTITIDK